MPDFATAAATISERFATQFHAAQPDVLIAFDNVKALKKSDGTYQQQPDTTKPWVRLNLRPGDAFQASIGRKRVWRHPGEIIVEIYAPKGSGFQKAHQIADSVAGIFRGQTVSDVRFEAPSPPQNVGPEADTAWHHWNVRTAYEFDLIA